jgi:hypothetical protein
VEINFKTGVFFLPENGKLVPQQAGETPLILLYN